MELIVRIFQNEFAARTIYLCVICVIFNLAAISPNKCVSFGSEETTKKEKKKKRRRQSKDAKCKLYSIKMLLSQLKCF